MSNKKIRYIGGTPIQSRITYLQRDPKLLSLIYELSNIYGVNPKLPLQRLMKEGVVDNAITLYNIRGKHGNTSPSVVDDRLLSAFSALGLDDSHSNIESGRTKLKRNISYGTSENVNEKNRVVYSAQADNNIDQLEILVAEIAGIRNHFKNKYPKYTDEELDILSNAAFNMGIGATEKHIKNKTINLTQKGNYALAKELNFLNLEEAYQNYGEIGKEIADRIPTSTLLPKTVYDTYTMAPKGTKKFGGKLRYGWGGVMSQSAIKSDMMRNPKKYGFNTLQDMTYTTKTNMNPFISDIYNDAYLGTAFQAYKFRRAYNNHASTDELLNLLDYEFTQGSDSRDYQQSWYDNGETSWIWDNQRHLFLNEGGMNKVNNMLSQQEATVNNIKNIIDDDIMAVRDVNNNNVVLQEQKPVNRFGGLINRPRFNYGGYYNDYSNRGYLQTPYSNTSAFNSPIAPNSISDREASYGIDALKQSITNQGAATGAGIGAGIGGFVGGIGAGAAAGALTAAGSTAWIPVIGPLVALGAAAIGAGIGAGVSKKKADLEASRQLSTNKQLISQNRELRRQTSMGNAINIIDKDVAKIRSMTPNYSSVGFYGRYGGLLGTARRKFDMGGILEPMSSDTILAHGRTHEEMDPITGQTGIAYKGAEIEDNEVVQETPQGDKVFSDSIISPRTGLTYAKNAEKISKSKGILENLKTQEITNLNAILEKVNKGKLSGAKLGTLIRNGEKKATHINKLTGEIFEKDLALDKLFNEQEQIATTLGLRDNTMMRYGGHIGRVYSGGGWIAPVISFGTNVLTSGLQYAATSSYNKYSQDVLDMLEQEEMPRQAYDEPILLDPEYDINPELEEVNRTAAYSKKFISDNVVNPQQRRNLMSKVGIEALQQINKLKGVKKTEEKKTIDDNIKEIGATRRSNRQKDYEYLVNKYNKKTNIALQRLQAKANQTQATQQLLRDLGQSATQAASMYVESKKWADGVTNDMNGITTKGATKRSTYRRLHNNDKYFTVTDANRVINMAKVPNWFSQTDYNNWLKMAKLYGIIQ